MKRTDLPNDKTEESNFRFAIVDAKAVAITLGLSMSSRGHHPADGAGGPEQGADRAHP
jgi:hypothetical protein